MTDPVPGDLVDLSRWRLMLPEADPGGGYVTVDPPELDEFELHPLFYANDDHALWMGCPVNGYSDTLTAGTELWELDAAGEPAAWPLDGTADHVLTALMMCDPSGVAGAREALVGQLACPGQRSPIELIVSHAGHPGALLAFQDGKLVGPLITGIRSDTLFHWRIAVTGGRGSRRCYLYAGIGESLSLSPAYSWSVPEFAHPSAPCQFRAGVRCIEPTTGTGRVFARLVMLSVI